MLLSINRSGGILWKNLEKYVGYVDGFYNILKEHRGE